MNSLVLLLILLLALILLAMGLSGRRPQPSDGSWVALSPTGRAGLIVAAFTVGLAALAWQSGWLPNMRSDSARKWSAQSAPSPYTPNASPAAASPTLWNEAASAQQQADARRAAGYPDPLPTTSAPAPEPAPQSVAAPAPAAPAPATPVPTAVAAAEAEPECECPPKKPKPAAKPASAVPKRALVQRARRAGDGRLNVCDVQQQYGITAASYGVADRADGGSQRLVSVSAGAGAVTVQNRLGPEQRREVLIVSVDGGSVGELQLGPGKRSGTLRLRLPAGGSARYQLSGYTEFTDGRRVPIEGEGWIEAADGRFDVRTADADNGGLLFLEPA